jgi:hypothetical protein
VNGKTPLGVLCGLVILAGLSACATAEPSAAGSTSAAVPSAVVASPAKTVSAADALKADCATFNTAFDIFIDQATNAGKLILGAGSTAASKTQGIKDLAMAYQVWEREIAKQATTATEPALKAALAEYAPLVKSQAEQLAALKDTNFTKITLEAKANEAQVKAATLCT